MDKTKYAQYGDISKLYGDSNRLYGGPFEFDHQIELWNGAVCSEILNPILKTFNWSYDRIGGCSDGSVIIKAAWTDYSTVTTSWKIKIKIRFEANTTYETVYTGEIIIKRKIISDTEQIGFVLAGYQEQLQKTVIYRHPVTDEPANYSSMTVKEVLIDLLDDYILPYTDIIYLDGDIGNPPITLDNILFDTTALNGIQLLATLAGNYEWGIDGEGYIHFKSKSTARDWNLYPGDYLEHAELEEDRTDLVNRIYLTGNYGLEEILEDENDEAVVQQTTINTGYPFGMVTTQNELMQTFTGISRLKDLTLVLSKDGFINIFVDGDMEMPGVANWLTYGSLGIKQKMTDTPYEELQYLFLNPPGTISGVYQSFTLTGGSTYNFSAVYRTNNSLYKVKFQIYNITDSVEISYFQENPKSWTAYLERFTVGGTGSKTVHIRIYGATFDLDSVSLFTNVADDIEVILVDISNPAIALKTSIIDHNLVGIYATAIKINMTYDFLNPATIYGIRIKRQGSLDDTSFYYLAGSLLNTYANGVLKNSPDGGLTWNNYTGDAYFIMASSQSQATYGVRSERIKNNSISSIEDARLWANSYLGGKNYPKKRGTLKMTSRTHWFERYKPLGLLAIRSSSGTQTEYAIDKIQYSLGENGLDISLELGSKIPKISDYLAWINYQLENLRS